MGWEDSKNSNRPLEQTPGTPKYKYERISFTNGWIFPTELTMDWQLEYPQKKFIEIDYGLNLT